MRVGAEKQMPYFVRNRGTDKRRHVDGRLTREPGNAVGINRRECAGTGRRVNE